MNILFVLYGDLGSNSAIPLALHTRELARAGHQCAVAIPAAGTSHADHPVVHGPVLTYAQALQAPEAVFPDGRPADIVHAWTPRENVRRFTTAWLARFPAPLVVYLEDNEHWIALQAIGCADTSQAALLTDAEIDKRLPDCLSHPFRHGDFTALADAAVVIQDKLAGDLPPWLPRSTVMPGVDLELFAPRAPDEALRVRYGVAPGEKVIVYPGGLNAITRPAIAALCRAVALVNARGVPCRLLRSGPHALDFLQELPAEARARVVDVGVLPRSELPQLLSLADLFVQPGQCDPFEDLRLPGKLPEFFAAGRPVVLPDANVATLLVDGQDAVLTRTGTPEEIADACVRILSDPALAGRLGAAARRFAQASFDPAVQAAKLLAVYAQARAGFDAAAAARVWAGADPQAPVAQLLARRLRGLADTSRIPDAAGMLREHARLLEASRARVQGLETALQDDLLAARHERELAAERRKAGEAMEQNRLEAARLHQLALQHAHAQARVDAVLHSTSWRVTAPLRAATTGVRRVSGVTRRLAAAVRQKGGPVQMAAAVWRVASSEGLPGLQRRLALFRATLRPAPGAGPGEPESPEDRNDYDEWVRRYDTLTDAGRVAMRERIARFPSQPLISIVMPTYNSEPKWLEEAVASVRAQAYPNWELCIADDASPKAHVREVLTRLAAAEPRIKLRFLEKNGHISAASNAALELASGEWIALMDHDDKLAESALFWVADAIHRHPEAQLIYSDEDKITSEGHRVTPYFKCDFNPFLFYSQNLITHLGVYRADLVRRVGGFTVGLEGAQDHDLALRCVEAIRPRQVHHIPRILYHWRMHSQSTAQSPEAKPYAAKAGVQALEQHFARAGVGARVEQVPCGYRVRFPLPPQPPLVSLVIPTRNGLQLLRQCITSILEKTRYARYEIIVVDNGSDDPATLAYLEQLRADPRVKVLRDDRPFNYSALNNAAVRMASGELVGLLNNDLEVISSDWLGEMVSLAVQPGVGAVGARLLFPDGSVQHAGVVLGIGGVAGHAHKHLPGHAFGYFGRAQSLQDFSAVTAACLVVRKAVYEQVGGLEEENLQVAFNDIDFCLRVREAGYRNVWTPHAELYHHESATRGYEDTPEKKARFAREVQYMQARWGDALLADPAYSPNLALACDDFSLAWPPRVDRVTALPAPAAPAQPVLAGAAE